jgi:hypothetical protein
MHRRSWLLVASVLIGCSGSDPGESGSPGSASTYYRDVAPIVQAHCASCHSPGNIGPFALETYDDAAKVAALMKKETAARTMPPWHVNGSGSCNTYRDARTLTDGEIETIADWVDAGIPAGDAEDAPPPREDVKGLDAVDATLDPGVAYEPDATLSDDYRCLLVDPRLSADRFLTAYEVHPGQPSEVHHVVVYSMDTPQDELAAVALDAGEEGPGYTCFGGSGTSSSRILAAWAPGTGVTRYPEGTGLRIVAGRKLVMQVHYNLSAGAKPDTTTIDLALAEHVDQEAIIGAVGAFDLNLSPGDPNASASAEFPLSDLPVSLKVHGVFPHMHKLGRTLHVDLEQGGTERCMVDVPDYRFGWQQFYFYDKPFVIEPGSGTMSIRCGFDTTGAKQMVHFGEGTGDEMCINALYATY